MKSVNGISIHPGHLISWPTLRGKMIVSLGTVVELTLNGLRVEPLDNKYYQSHSTVYLTRADLITVYGETNEEVIPQI